MRRRAVSSAKLALSLGLISLVVPSGAAAYPIFFSCDSNGHANDTLDTKAIRSKVLAALKSPNSDSEIAAMCKGQAECFEVLKQSFLLTVYAADAANRLFEEEVAKINARMDALKKELSEEMSVDPAVTETARNLIVMANAINDCRIAQQNRDPGDFNVPNREATESSSGTDVFLLHGVDNEYNHVMGVGATEAGDYKADYDQIGSVIFQAVASNLDPYMALAIAYLEAGEPKTFVLDPSPAIETLGCPLKVVARVNDANVDAYEAENEKLLELGVPYIYNWGTFSTFVPDGGKPDGHATQATREVARQMAEQKGKWGNEVEYDGPSLACVQNEGGFLAKPDGTLIKKFNDGLPDETLSVNKACCMRIPYASRSAFVALANIYARNQLTRPGNGPTAIQRFNGSGVIGITEKAGVGAFRYGIHMGSEPQYGNQGMDYVVNSFMGNPGIRAIVAQAEAEFGKRPPSVLCAGRKPGTFAVDSDRYVDAQRSMVRLRTVVGKTWAQLANARNPGKPSLNQEMIRGEYEFATKFLRGGEKWRDYPNLTRAENDRARAAATELDRISDPSAKWDYYRKNVYPYRDTLEKVSTKTWDRFSDDQIRGFQKRLLAAPTQEEYDAERARRRAEARK